MERSTRRQMLSSVLLGSGAIAVIPTTNVLGQESEITLGDIDPREFHRQQVDYAQRSLNGYRALSRQGVEAALTNLMNRSVIVDSDYDAIRDIVSILYNGEHSPQEKTRSIVRRYDEVQREVGDVARVIMATEADSAEYVMENFPNVPESFVVLVAHDLRGAIDGASAGATFGMLFGRAVMGALFGALAGGASGSIIAYFGSDR